MAAAGGLPLVTAACKPLVTAACGAVKLAEEPAPCSSVALANKPAAGAVAPPEEPAAGSVAPPEEPAAGSVARPKEAASGSVPLPEEPAACASTALTREHIREELQHFAEESLRHELRVLSTGLKAEICKELQLESKLHVVLDAWAAKLPSNRPLPQRRQEPIRSRDTSEKRLSAVSHRGTDSSDAPRQYSSSTPSHSSATDEKARPQARSSVTSGTVSSRKSLAGTARIGTHKFMTMPIMERPMDLKNGAVSSVPPAVVPNSKLADALETQAPPVPGTLEGTFSDIAPTQCSPIFSELARTQMDTNAEAPSKSKSQASYAAHKSKSRLVLTDIDQEAASCAVAIGNRAKKMSTLSSDNDDDLFDVTKSPMRALVRRFLKGNVFEYVIIGSIFVNALTIGAQTDYMARTRSEDTHMVFYVFETIFCVVFSLELFLRLYVYRCRFFIQDGWRWNVFDFTVVSIQLVEKSFEVIEALTSDDTSSGSSFGFMRIMRILRLIRVVRLVRLLRLINELRTIVASLLGSMKSLCWTMTLLLLLMYIIGVYFTQVVTDHRILEVREEGIEIMTEKKSNLYTLFSNLPRSILSLFQAMSGGIDWDDMAGPLIEEISPVLGLVIALYIAFALLALMNVVTGVFVESALKNATDEQETFMVQHARALFQRCDADKSGKLNWNEFTSQMEEPEMMIYFKLIEVDIEEACELFRLLDIDKSGEVDYEEFLNGCLRLRGNAKAIDLVTMMLENRMQFHSWSVHTAALEEDLAWIVDSLEAIKFGNAGAQQTSKNSASENVDSDEVLS